MVGPVGPEILAPSGFGPDYLSKGFNCRRSLRGWIVEENGGSGHPTCEVLRVQPLWTWIEAQPTGHSSTVGLCIYGLYEYVHLMAQATHAPSPEFASPGANPTLETIEYIRSALQRADGPLSRNQLLEILSEWGHSTTRASLNAALRFLEANGNIASGSKGVFWVPPASVQLEEILRTGPRL